MELQLPKWIIEELDKGRGTKSIQTYIKDIMREYVESEEGIIIRERIEGKRRKKEQGRVYRSDY